MSYPLSNSIGEYVAARLALASVAGTGSAQNGAALDRIGFLSAVGVVAFATAGGVTGGTITGQFQTSADGATGWTAIGVPVAFPVAAGPNAAGAFNVPINLALAQRYVRLSVTAAPTGGTPASTVSAVVEFGGADHLPAV